VAVPMLLLGGGAVSLALIGLTVGWGRVAGPLPLGSHRSVLAAMVLALMVGGALGAIFVAVTWPSMEMGGVLACAGTGMYGTLLAVVYARGVRSGLVNLGSLGVSGGRVLEAVGWGAFGAAVILIVAAVNGLALQALGQQDPQRDMFAWLRDRPIIDYVLAGLAVAVVAPVVEELFFRGYVLNAYLSAKGTRTAYLASAFAFALMHGLPTLFPAIFVMGLVLAYLYRRTGTILASMVAHGINNGLAFAALVSAISR